MKNFGSNLCVRAIGKLYVATPQLLGVATTQMQAYNAVS
jgi:hypothetical protein